MFGTWQTITPNRHDVVMVPILWVAIALSLLVHVAALWIVWPHLHLLSTDKGQPRASSTLAVELTPRTRMPSSTPPAAPSAPAIASIAPRAPAPSARAARPQRPPPSRAPPRRPPAPPVIALDRRTGALQALPVPPPAAAPPSVAPSPPAPAPEPPKPAPPPLESDLASYVEARRRARGEETPSSAGSATNAPAAESEIERRNRIIASNLGLNRTPTFGYDPQSAGGIFQITHIGYDDAQFWFFGLDRDIGRKAKQMIDVRKGSNSDIRIAIVRKMIAIIRQNVSGDFLWSSQRMGREIPLSARPADNAELEDFIMRDVFPEARVP